MTRRRRPHLDRIARTDGITWGPGASFSVDSVSEPGDLSHISVQYRPNVIRPQKPPTQCEMRLRVGPGFINRGDLVFPGPDGEPWRPSTFAAACRRVFKKAGLTCRLHDLRHTQATMLLRQGVHPKVVQERLGHANVSITLDIYSHCTANMQQEAAEKIDEALREALAR